MGYQSSIDPRPILLMIGVDTGIGLFERPTVMSHPSYAGWFSFLLLFAPRPSGPVILLKTQFSRLLIKAEPGYGFTFQRQHGDLTRFMHL